MKKFIVLLLLAGTAGFSYFYSGQVYHYFLSNYYFKYKKETRTSLFSRAENMLKEKKYLSLEKYLHDLEVLYPDDADVQKLEAINLMKSGKKIEGAELILSIRDKTGIPSAMLEDTVEVLFNQEFYTDIIDVMKTNESNNPNVLYYYGVSLFMQGKPARALPVLKRAVVNGRTDYRSYLYIGLALERMKENKESLRYLKEAWQLKYKDPDVNRALVRVYHALGKYNDAAKILQEQKSH
jgi:tetratricopeptide (TPR) repeat protein